MAKSDTNSPKSAGENLEAPVQLNPDELEAVAGGMAKIGGKGTGTTTTGAVSPKPTAIKLTQ